MQDKYKQWFEGCTEQESVEYPVLDSEGCSHPSWKDLIMERLGFCGCGMPDEALAWVVGGLRIIDKGDRDALLARFHGDHGAYYQFCYWADDKGLEEHGTSTPGWLTAKGKELVAFFDAECAEEVF